MLRYIVVDYHTGEVQHLTHTSICFSRQNVLIILKPHMFNYNNKYNKT